MGAKVPDGTVQPAAAKSVTEFTCAPPKRLGETVPHSVSTAQPSLTRVAPHVASAQYWEGGCAGDGGELGGDGGSKAKNLAIPSQWLAPSFDLRMRPTLSDAYPDVSVIEMPASLHRASDIAGGVVPRLTPAMCANVRVPVASRETVYQLKANGSAVVSMNRSLPCAVPDEMYAAPPGGVCQNTPLPWPQAAGPKMNGGMLLSGAL